MSDSNSSCGWITQSLGGLELRSHRGIALLEAIAEAGSINRAARKLGMSYKAAWEQVDLLNSLAKAPLISRTVGGRGGGGTVVTAAGLALIRNFRQMEREFQKFRAFIEADLTDAAAARTMIRRMALKVSARNVWSGQVRTIRPVGVRAEISIALRGGDRVVAVVTQESLETLQLIEGCDVFVLAKASSVMLASRIDPKQAGAGNVLRGRVARLVEGDAGCDVTLDLAGGMTLSATIPAGNAGRLDLSLGSEACALIAASSLMLAVA